MNNLVLNLIVMAGITYLIRMVPLALVRGKIKSKFIKSFLFYIPYAVLAAMTFPSVFYSTGSVIPAVCATAVAVGLAYLEKGLLTVAITSCAVAYVVDLIMKII